MSDQPTLVPAVNHITHPGVQINFMATTIERLAGLAYTAYCEEMGGKAFDGTPLRPWSECSLLPQGEGWRAAVRKVITLSLSV